MPQLLCSETPVTPQSPARPRAAVASEAGRVTVQLGEVVLEIVTETASARAQLTMTEGRWQVRIVDA